MPKSNFSGLRFCSVNEEFRWRGSKVGDSGPETEENRYVRGHVERQFRRERRISTRWRGVEARRFGVTPALFFLRDHNKSVTNIGLPTRQGVNITKLI
ncbi:hypothetical protein AVEN_80793-1 [Araneus ventricosus]|uniref:Uncharacterized protein n=1 Tax=Araneus ventricosus TaxID=182803 RepID=A0A4Y2FI82_ARAVE|nr:hypothetical protein AVEN_80793-1 [Araneus ventricosus]